MANAAEAMRAGRPVVPAALPAEPAASAAAASAAPAASAAQGALVPVADAEQRPGFLPPALPADGRGQAGHQGGDDRGDHGGSVQILPCGDGLQGGEGRGNGQGQVDQRAQAGGGRLLGPLALPPGPQVDSTLALRPPDLASASWWAMPVQREGEGQRVVRALPQGAEVHAAERQRPHDGHRDQHGMMTREGQAQTVEVNPFWSDRVQREI